MGMAAHSLFFSRRALRIMYHARVSVQLCSRQDIEQMQFLCTRTSTLIVECRVQGSRCKKIPAQYGSDGYLYQ